MTTRQLFLNLPVADLDRAVAFFTALGFTFNKQFTDDKATCMVVSDQAYVMLLVDERFKDFTKRDIADRTSVTEAITALSASSKAEVDEFADKALAAGATDAMPTMDLGFMYGRSFYDLDGHHWEIFYMDPSALQQPQ